MDEQINQKVEVMSYEIIAERSHIQQYCIQIKSAKYRVNSSNGSNLQERYQ